MSKKNNTFVTLVNHLDIPIATAPKLAAHQYGLCHRAFSIVLLRDTPTGLETLLQQRHPDKYHCGNLWTNTCCSHPFPDEAIQKAAKRRLFEEVGLSSTLTFLDKFHYCAILENQLIENEIDYVFLGYEKKIKPISDYAFNSNEILKLEWVNFNNLFSLIEKTPQKYTPWLKQVLAIVSQHIPETFGF